MNIYEKLLNIQSELKAPKNQHNTFGNYDFRSAEDILEAVKPICKKHNVLLTLNDEIVMVGNRHYVKATALLTDIESETISQYETSAYAREEDGKKGMDSSQVTGATSSYARKYALNGLFCIDDTKDADTDSFKKQQNKPEQKNTNKTVTQVKPIKAESIKLISEGQRKRLYAIASGNNDVAKRVLGRYGYDSSEKIRVADYEQICNEIESEILM